MDDAHGLRRTYHQGCRCRRCRAANTAYHAQLRRRKAQGRPLLGALVSAVEARRRIRQLKREGYTETRIAHMAGWKDRHLQTSDREHMRLKTLARIRRVAAFAMLEGARDAPWGDRLQKDPDAETRPGSR